MTKDKLIIPESCYKVIMEHGRSNLPYESCGLVSGKGRHVQTVWKLVNEIKSDRRYFVGEKVIERTLEQIDKKKEKVIAIYHSHPATEPIPSSYDIVNHPNDELVMMIISYKSDKPQLKCYRVHNKTYNECLFLIDPNS
ncbi:Mov34/MPN/PAD-1 family protein [Halalkalibacter okhensis]|uniref:MPN domain-containing protein n=1 Tax=Halalkalibacter okhensis TaxID=333138 RepID=A0A0B0IGB1_9BACI|nr:M67 family metallopeptidase [Halalkalibacter okhensis]KHF39867.1 hypothetical protein LQ50_12425 [Halalkalibacter okhensis]